MYKLILRNNNYPGKTSKMTETENFYESFSIERYADENGEFYDAIIITPPTNLPSPDDIQMSEMITRDWCPLFYTMCYINPQDTIPSMSCEELYDTHQARNEGRGYDPTCVLNHGWVDRLKEVAGWTPGTELIFDASCSDNITIISYNLDPNYAYKHKIDDEGYLCSAIRIPFSRTHLHGEDESYFYTKIQRVVCWYNLQLEEQGMAYVLK